jgi:hypothetical protein
VRGNIPAPFADVVSWWTAAERASEMRSKLERRVGPKTTVVWSEGANGAARWVEAQWKIPGRTAGARWHLVRYEPQVMDGRGSQQLRLTSSLTTEHKTRRGRDVVTKAVVETLLLDRDARTEVRYEQAWKTTGASVVRQLRTRQALAAVAKADVADMMLRCEADVRARDAGQTASA